MSSLCTASPLFAVSPLCLLSPFFTVSPLYIVSPLCIMSPLCVMYPLCVVSPFCILSILYSVSTEYSVSPLYIVSTLECISTPYSIFVLYKLPSGSIMSSVCILPPPWPTTPSLWLYLSTSYTHFYSNISLYILMQYFVTPNSHYNRWRMKDQLDVTCYFISLIMCSTCFGH